MNGSPVMNLKAPWIKSCTVEVSADWMMLFSSTSHWYSFRTKARDMCIFQLRDTSRPMLLLMPVYTMWAEITATFRNTLKDIWHICISWILPVLPCEQTDDIRFAPYLVNRVRNACYWSKLVWFIGTELSSSSSRQGCPRTSVPGF